MTLQIPPIGVSFLDDSGCVRLEWYLAIERSLGTAQATADAGVSDAAGAQSTADQAAADAAAAQGTADGAQSGVDTISTAAIVTYGASASFANDRILSGSTGVTLDVSTPGQIIVTVDVAAALGYIPADLAGAAFTGPVDVQALLRCDSLRIDVTPAASVAVPDLSFPITTDSGTIYVMASTVP